MPCEVTCLAERRDNYRTNYDIEYIVKENPVVLKEERGQSDVRRKEERMNTFVHRRE